MQAVGGGPGEEGGHVRLPNIEFSYIKQLQRDNSELRTLLEEHQAALQMIMTKYREQVRTLLLPRPPLPPHPHPSPQPSPSLPPSLPPGQYVYGDKS